MATYYVSNSGSDDTGNGSELNPWATPRKAGEVLTTGDTLFIRGGSYNVDAWNHTTGQKFCQAAGTALARILISAAIDSSGNLEPVTFIGAIRRADSFFFLPHYMTWRGFNFPNGGFAPHGNSTSDRLIGWTISHCTIRGGCTDDPAISDASNVAAVNSSDNDGMTIEDCEITEIEQIGSVQGHGGDGFKLYNTSNLTVQHCYIHDNYQQAYQDKQGGMNNIIRRCIIKDNPYGEQIRISTQADGSFFNSGAQVYENIFILTTYPGGEVMAVNIRTKTNGTKVFNNVSYGGGGFQMSADYDADSPSDINTNCDIYNNVVVPTVHSSMKFFVSQRWDANLPVLMDYNCYYGSYNWMRNRYANLGAGEGDRDLFQATSLGGWQTGNDSRSRSDIDDHSINTNPLFVDPTAYTAAGFQLQAGSPCLGTGYGGLDMGCYPRRDNTVIGIRPFNSNTVHGPVRARSVKSRGKGRFW